MVRAREQSKPVVISHFDVPHSQELLVYSCEDCACAVSNDTALPLSGYPSATEENVQWVCGEEAIEVPVDEHHRALFNPVGHGGVVVVNQSSQQIFSRFRSPATLQSLQNAWPGESSDLERTVGRLGELGLIHPAGEDQLPAFQASKVLTAWLHVTNACNLRCPYCYVHKTSDKMDERVGYASVDAVLNSAVTHGFSAVKLKYAGGEASLNEQLMVSMHARAKEKAAALGLSLYATLLSNGVTLSSRLIETLKCENIGLMISLDGVGEQHDVQRPSVNGKPSFHLVERTIAKLIDQGCPPHLSITITSRNIAGVAEAVRFALERDLTFSLNLFRENECAATFPDLRYAESSMITGLLESFSVVEEFMPRWSVLGAILDRGQLIQPRQHSCGVGRDYVVIDQQGGVAKCHMEIEKTLGTVFLDDPLLLVQRDKKFVQNLPVEEKSGCRDCSWRYWCSGGCSIATFRATGRYDIKSPNCEIYKAIYPEALRLEGLRLLKYAAR